MPTREYSEEEKQEAREAGERLKEECEHSKRSGECLLYHAMCYFEDQKECSEYGPKFSKDYSKKIWKGGKENEKENRRKRKDEKKEVHIL